jgi:hypothetical protein
MVFTSRKFSVAIFRKLQPWVLDGHPNDLLTPFQTINGLFLQKINNNARPGMEEKEIPPLLFKLIPDNNCIISI